MERARVQGDPQAKTLRPRRDAIPGSRSGTAACRIQQADDTEAGRDGHADGERRRRTEFVAPVGVRQAISVPRISFIVPTFHSRRFFGACFPPLAGYADSELIVVDNHSGDVAAAAAFGARTYTHGPDQNAARVFGAPFQRDFGARKATGTVLYFVDADMVVNNTVIDEALDLIAAGSDAVIVREESVGVGFWARCKWLERRCYWGDDHIEAPRVVRRDVYLAIGGFDGTVAPDDWDLARRLRAAGYSVARTTHYIVHDEGQVGIARLARKRFLYSRHAMAYVKKHHSFDIQQATFLRLAYLRHWRILLSHPLEAVGMMFMKLVEFGAVAVGVLASAVSRPAIRLRDE